MKSDYRYNKLEIKLEIKNKSYFFTLCFPHNRAFCLNQDYGIKIDQNNIFFDGRLLLELTNGVLKK